MKKVIVGFFNFTNSVDYPIEEYFLELREYCYKLKIVLPDIQIYEKQRFPLLSDMLLSDDILSRVRLDWPSLFGKLKYLIFTNKFAPSDIPNLIIFLLPDNWPISGNSVLHGGSLATYKDGIAIVGFNKEYKEVFFHELFHFFGVSEGYDEITHINLQGCDSCWMQFNPKLGNGLCHRHKEDLFKFLSSV